MSADPFAKAFARRRCEREDVAFVSLSLIEKDAGSFSLSQTQASYSAISLPNRPFWPFAPFLEQRFENDTLSTSKATTQRASKRPVRLCTHVLT